MRILIVSPYLPHPDIGHGGGQAVRSLVRALGRRHDCRLVSLWRPGEPDPATAAGDLGVEVVAVPFLDRRAAGIDRLRLGARRLGAVARGCRDRYPYYAAKYAARALSRAVTETADAFDPDVIQVEYLQLAYLLRDLRGWRDAAGPAGRGRGPRPRLILDSHEVGSLPRRRRAAQVRGWRRAWLLREAAAWDRLARDASGWADTTLCVTEQDRELLAAAGGRRLVTVPLGIETHGPPAERLADRPPRALFLGSFQHPPNRSAAALLCDEIWPRTSAELPDWELVLAGPGSDAFLASRGALPRVRAAGYVADLGALFAGCRLFAAPLTEGGGIKIKILEAMARGLPVVTTPIGTEGILTADDDLVWLAQGRADFAAQLVAAARDLARAAERAERARRHVEERFSWPAVVRLLETVYGAPTAPAGAGGGLR